MEEVNKDAPEVQETQDGEAKDDEVVVVTDGEEKPLTPEEIADLKKKAEVSSQNFERAKKAEEEAKKLKQRLEEEGSSDTDYEDVEQLKTKISEIEGQLQRSKVLDQYPVLKDVWTEFEEYTQSEDNQGMRLETAAKAFITEKELNTPQRKGLEKGTGGDKTPRASGMTQEQLETLRKNDGKKYRDMLKKGQIKFK